MLGVTLYVNIEFKIFAAISIATRLIISFDFNIFFTSIY